MITKWDTRFLELAKTVSTWSKDPSTQCGAVIVDEHRRVLGIGYNGLPRGVPDDSELLWNREIKYKYIVHAEVNAILNAVKEVRGCTLYIWPMPACNECAKLIAQAGIARVVSPMPTQEQRIRWHDSFNAAYLIFNHANVKVDRT